jgi:4'-phosphopantetheinyl transferase
MGLFCKKNYECGSILGIWEITESVDELSLLIINNLNLIEKDILEDIKHNRRKAEWLASRVLVKELLGYYSEIYYDAHGRPFLKNNLNISISHSEQLVAVLISKEEEIGIDIQKMSDKIAKVALKFLNDDEILNIDLDKSVQHLYANWCAKETLLKIYGRKYIDFRQNIIIPPFKFTDEGKFTGKIQIASSNQEYLLNYQTIFIDNHYSNNYMMVWYCGCNSSGRLRTSS